MGTRTSVASTGATSMESEAFAAGLSGEPTAPGMVRIRRGEQLRWIWPVHLPGWIALGWQVAHRGGSVLDGPTETGRDVVAGALAGTAAPETAGALGRMVVDTKATQTTEAKEEPVVSSPANGIPPRQRRGKRRHAEEPTPSAAAGVSDSSGAPAESAPPTDTVLNPDSEEITAIDEPTGSGNADASAALGIDDLLLDPLL